MPGVLGRLLNGPPMDGRHLPTDGWPLTRRGDRPAGSQRRPDASRPGHDATPTPHCAASAGRRCYEKGPPLSRGGASGAPVHRRPPPFLVGVRGSTRSPRGQGEWSGAGRPGGRYRSALPASPTRTRTPPPPCLHFSLPTKPSASPSHCSHSFRDPVRHYPPLVVSLPPIHPPLPTRAALSARTCVMGDEARRPPAPSPTVRSVANDPLCSRRPTPPYRPPALPTPHLPRRRVASIGVYV